MSSRMRTEALEGPATVRRLLVSDTEPLYRVATQLNTLTALGMATLKLIAENSVFSRGDWPEVNMWCPQTMKLNIAMAIELNAMKR